MTYLQSLGICTVTFKMAPNRGASSVQARALKLAEILTILLLFNCVNVLTLEGVMNSRDQEILRQTGKSITIITLFLPAYYCVYQSFVPLTNSLSIMTSLQTYV